MRTKQLLFILACCILAVGCNAAKVDELTREVEELRQQNQQLEADLQAAREALQEAEKARDQLEQQAAQAAEIRRGYEQAREEFQQKIAGLGAILGAGPNNPLPPFEELKNSDWIGKLMPGGAINLETLESLKNLKDVESDLLKDLFPNQGDNP